MRSLRVTSSNLRRNRVAIGVDFLHRAFEALEFAEGPAHDAVFTADLLQRREAHAHLLRNGLLRQVEVLRELLELYRCGRHERYCNNAQLCRQLLNPKH